MPRGGLMEEGMRARREFVEEGAMKPRWELMVKSKDLLTHYISTISTTTTTRRVECGSRMIATEFRL